MSEEKLTCPCGCGTKKTYQEAFDEIFKRLNHDKEIFNTLIHAINDCKILFEQIKNKKDIIIESICEDMEKINERLDKLEGKNNQATVCFDKDVKPL